MPSPDTAAWLGLDEVAYPQTSVTRLFVAPDAEEEVRLAVRSALDHLADKACRPDRIGIAYTAPVPYNRLLAEQLTVAGLPHHMPSTRTLAQTIAGRAVHGLLSLDVRGLPRADMLRWMAEGPLLDRHGYRLRPSRWERLSRDAGVSRGVETWVDRLDRYADQQRAEAIRRPEESSRYDARALAADALREEVTDLHAAAETVLSASTWAEVADSAVALLRRTLGSHRAVDRWSAGLEGAEAARVQLEQAAYDSVHTLLGSLHDTAGPVTPGAVLTTLTEGLGAADPSGTTLGRGVLVGSLRSFDGADLDLLLVLGCTEDSLPGRQRESTVLRDADRALLSAQLATVTTRRAAERQRWEAVLTSARTVHLSYPRADSRAQRRQFASPWFLEQAKLLASLDGAGPVTGAQVDKGKLKAAWFHSCASFEQSLLSATTYVSAHELDVAVALHGEVDRLARTDLRLARGLNAARSRGVGAFDAWSGRTGELPASVRADVDAHLSASTLQTWATCPASHLFGAMLGVRELEDRAGEDTIDARDKGNLVHGVLEKLLRPHLRTDSTLGISPDTAWGPDDLARAVEILEADAKDLEEQGLTGREVLWTAQLARLWRSLVRLLAHDSTLRRDRQSTPVAVEAAFGRDGAAHLVVDLPSQGPVPFAGFIDRIDSTASGGLVVVDYKTGTGSGYDTIPKHTQPKPDADLLDRGRKLQLLLYALAARQLQGLPDAAVQAWFWFVEKGDLHRGGLVTDAQQRRLETVLDTVVGGIRGGVFPANPGEETWRSGAQTWESCRFCAFDRVCPTTRGEQWAGHRSDADVRPYAELVEPVRTTP